MKFNKYSMVALGLCAGAAMMQGVEASNTGVAAIAASSSSASSATTPATQMTLVLATSNEGKIKEMAQQLERQFGISVIGLPRDYISPKEDGKTCQANAQIKADAAHADPRFKGMMILAEDSALFLDNFPNLLGVDTAEFVKKYPGKDKKDHTIAFAQMHKEVGEKATPGYYLSVMHLIDPDGKAHIFEDSIHAMLRFNQVSTGKNGFAWDNVFYPDELNGEGKPLVSFADVSVDKKNEISHRGKALAQLLTFLAAQKSAAKA